MSQLQLALPYSFISTPDVDCVVNCSMPAGSHHRRLVGVGAVPGLALPGLRCPMIPQYGCEPTCTATA
jgi:hypothetical protein